jgi:hypothetical protein
MSVEGMGGPSRRSGCQYESFLRPRPRQDKRPLMQRTGREYCLLRRNKSRTGLRYPPELRSMVPIAATATQIYHRVVVSSSGGNCCTERHTFKMVCGFLTLLILRFRAAACGRKTTHFLNQRSWPPPLRVFRSLPLLWGRYAMSAGTSIATPPLRAPLSGGGLFASHAAAKSEQCLLTQRLGMRESCNNDVQDTVSQTEDAYVSSRISAMLRPRREVKSTDFPDRRLHNR